MNERITSCTVLKKTTIQTPHSVNKKSEHVGRLCPYFQFPKEKKNSTSKLQFGKGREAKRKRASVSFSSPFDLISLKISEFVLQYDILRFLKDFRKTVKYKFLRSSSLKILVGDPSGDVFTNILPSKDQQSLRILCLTHDKASVTCEVSILRLWVICGCGLYRNFDDNCRLKF